MDECHGGRFAYRCMAAGCDQVFADTFSMHRHKVKAHPAETVVCSICAANVRKCTMALHLRDVHGEATVACDSCDLLFPSAQKLKDHKNKVHNKAPCPECGKMVAQSQAKYHMLSAHTREEDKPWVCKICQPLKGFTDLSRYTEHMNIHLGRKPFKCPECSMSFASHGTMAGHVKGVHKGLKRSSKWDGRK